MTSLNCNYLLKVLFLNIVTLGFRDSKHKLGVVGHTIQTIADGFGNFPGKMQMDSFSIEDGKFSLRGYPSTLLWSNAWWIRKSTCGPPRRCCGCSLWFPGVLSRIICKSVWRCTLPGRHALAAVHPCWVLDESGKLWPEGCLRLASLKAEPETGVLVQEIYWRNALNLGIRL